MDSTIECFMAVAKTGSFTQAAEELFFSQQAVSSYVSRLEKTLNAKLFNREKRTVELTPAGRHYYYLFRSAIQREQRSAENARYIQRKQIKILRIGCSEWIDPFGEIGDAVKKFKRDNSDIDIKMLVHSNSELLRELNENEIDVVLFSDAHVPEKYGLISEPVANEEIALFGPREIVGESLPTEKIKLRKNMRYYITQGYECSYFEMLELSEQEVDKMGLSEADIRFVPNVMSLCSAVALSNTGLAVSDRRFGRLRGLEWLGSELLENGTAVYITYKQMSENPLIQPFVQSLREFSI